MRSFLCEVSLFKLLMQNIEQLIKLCPWFIGVPEGEIHSLTKAARIKHFDSSKYLYRLGDKTDSIYAVIKGFVRIKISSAQGQEFAITEFSNNAWFGEYSLTDKPARMFEAQALEHSTIVEIPKSVVRTIAEKYPIVYKNLFNEQSEHTLKMCELLNGMLFYPLSGRVAGRLMWFAQNFGSSTEHGTLIHKKMSQQELADLTLGSRQRVNKTLKHFEKLEILSIKGQQYLVKDMDKLKQQINLNNEN